MYYLQHEKTREYVSSIVKLRGADAYAVYFKAKPDSARWATEEGAQAALGRLLDCEYTNPRGVALDLAVVNLEERQEAAHMNELAAAQDRAPARSLMEIEADILSQKRTIGRSIVIIGHDLIEAKGKMEHGLWGTWLAERVNFSQSTAENYMKIAEQVDSDSALLNLPYTKVLALLAVPAEEREEFAAANNVEDKSVAQIKQLIREKEEAEKTIREQQKTIDMYTRDKLRTDNQEFEASEKIRKLEEQINAERRDQERLTKMLNREREHVAHLMAREPDTVTVEKEVIPPDYEAVKAERAKLEEQLRTAMVRLNQAEDSLEEAEERARAAQAEAQRAQMARIDEDEADNSDPLAVIPFSSACLDFTGALYAAPISAGYFSCKSADDLRRYRLMADTVLAWAQNTIKALDEAESRQAAGGEDYAIA